MPFVTKVDYSDNRQIKQFQLTNTNLSGTTVFGMDYSGLTGGVNASSVVVTGTYANIISTFSGNSTTTTFFFGQPEMVPGVITLEPITSANSGDTQVGIGYEGINPTIIDGNTVYGAYTGSTFDLTVTSIEEIGVDEWTGITNSITVTLLSGSSSDFIDRTIWVDVKGITRTKRLILTDELDNGDGNSTVLGRDLEGNVVGIQLSGLTGTTGVSSDDYTTGATFNNTTGIIGFTRLSGGTYNVDIGITSGDTTNWNSAYGDTITGMTVTGSATKTITLFQTDGGTITANFTDNIGGVGGSGDVVTGMTFNTGNGILTLTTLSGDTITEDLDGRYLTGSTEDSGTTILSLDNPIGTYYDMASANSATGYTLSNQVLGGWAKVLINAPSEPSVTGATQEVGSTFIDNTDMYLVAYHDGVIDKYYFILKTGATSGTTDTDDYVTGGTFNTLTGDLTLTRLSGGTVITNLDDRYSLTGHTHPEYLTGFTQTDDYVTGATFNTGDGILEFTRLSGGTFNVDLDDRYSLTGHTHSEYLTGFTQTDDYLTGHTFNTTTGLFESTLQSGSTVSVNLDGRYSLTGHTHSEYLTGYTDTFVTGSTFNTGDGILEFTNTSGGTFNVDLDGRYLTGFTETPNTDDYLTGHTFNTTTGLFESTLQSGSTVSVNLDGRYLEISAYTDNYVTGFTYSSTGNTFTIQRNNALNDLDVEVNTFSGLTITNELSAYNVSATTINPVDFIQFNTGYTGNTVVEGRMYWSEDDQTIVLGMHTANGDVLQQIGQELYYLIKNQSGSTINDGRVVRAAGTLGSSGRILGEYMIADGSIEEKYTLGVATQDIPNGEDGYVTEFGVVRGIDTTGSPYGETWNDGDVLWVSATIAGGLTNVEPIGPNLKIEIAIVVHSDANGSIFVRPNRYPHFHDLQEATWSGGTESNLDIIQWNDNLSGWTITSNPTFNSISATTISGDTIYSGGTNLIEIINNSNTDDFTTGATWSSGTEIIEFTRLSGGTYNVDLSNTYSLTGHTHPEYLTGFTQTDDYLTGHTFNTSTGLFESTLQSGSTVSVNLDGRYSLTGHTHPEYLTGFTQTDDYVTGSTFNTGNGILEFTRISGGTFNVDLDGRYLTGSTEDSGTTVLSLHNPVGTYYDMVSANSATGYTISNEVLGGWAKVLINASAEPTVSGATKESSIEFVSGDDMYLIAYNNGVGNKFYILPTTGTTSGGTGGSFDDDYVTGSTFNTGDGILEFTRISGGTFNVDLDGRYSLTGHTHPQYLTGFTQTDDYVTGSTFNTGTGDLTLIRLSGGTIVTNLDDRYSLTGHTHDISEISGYTDTFVTGSTFNTTNGILEFTNTSGGTFNVDLDNRYSLTGHTHDLISRTVVVDASNLGNSGTTKSKVINYINSLGYNKQTDNPDLWFKVNPNYLINANLTFDVSGEPLGLTVSSGGTILYISRHNSSLVQYNLSTPWDVSTAVQNTTNATLGQGGGLHITSDGMHIVFSNGDITSGDTTVYLMTSPHDLTTLSAISTTALSAFTGGALKELYITDDGLEFYAKANTELIHYTLSTPWDITTATETDSWTKSINHGFTFNSDLTKVYITQNGDILEVYPLSSAGDLSTVGSLEKSIDLTSVISGNFKKIFLSPNNKKLIITSYLESPDVITLTLNVADEIGSIYETDNPDLVIGDSYYRLINFSDGIVSGVTNDDLEEIVNGLSTSFYDLDNIPALSDNYLTGHTFNTATGLFESTLQSGGTVSVNLDGRYLQITGSTGDDYLTGGTFNTLTGDLDLTLQSGSTVTINLDDRYSLTGHTHPEYITGSTTGTDDYLTGHTFNTSTGLFESTLQSGSTVSVNLDGRYLLLSATTGQAALIFSPTGNTTGIIKSGRTEANYGDIGLEAVDLSNSITLSGVYGATGDYSLASGDRSTASGFASVALGNGPTSTGTSATSFGFLTNSWGNASFVGGYFSSAKGDYSTAFGSFNNALGTNSTAFGNSTTANGLSSMAWGSATSANASYSTAFGGDSVIANGQYSTASGRHNIAPSYGETNIGLFSTTGNTIGNPSSWVGADRIFNVGNGINLSFRSDALTILKYGDVIAPSLSIGIINSADTRVLITKEYADANYSGGTGGSSDDDYLTGGTFNDLTGDLTLSRLSGGTVVTNLDNRYHPIHLPITQASHGFNIADAVRLDGSTWVLAIADSPENSGTLGLVSASADTNNFTIQTSGVFSGGTWTSGTDYFLSNTVSGSVVTEPTYLLNEVRQYIGTALSTTELLLEVDLGDEIVEDLDNYIENLNVVSPHNINWYYETHRISLSGNTTLTDSNLPTSGVYSKAITLYVDGDFTLTLPAAWQTYVTGTYDGTTINQIVVEYIKSGLYWVDINRAD